MAWPAALAAVGAFAGAQANNMWNWTMNKKAAKTAFNRQRELYMLDYRLHTPSNQMKLLKEANLNPNLIYGEGNAGSVSVHMPSVASADPARAGNAGAAALQGLEAYQDWKLKDASIQNTEASKAKEDALTGKLKADASVAQERAKQEKIHTRMLQDSGSDKGGVGSLLAGGARKLAMWGKEAWNEFKSYNEERRKQAEHERWREVERAWRDGSLLRDQGFEDRQGEGGSFLHDYTATPRGHQGQELSVRGDKPSHYRRRRGYYVEEYDQ